MVPSVLGCMGELFSIREGVESAPRDLTEVIELAYRKATSTLASTLSPVPKQQACTILINGIISAARRGNRDVDQLANEAFALLKERTMSARGSHDGHEP
jgi:hypothetical protein